MKKSKKLILAGLVLSALLAGLSGCKGKEPQKEEGETKEFVYVPEYVDIDIECDYIYAMAAVGDELYMNAVAWDDEEDERHEFLYKYNMLESKGEQLPIALEGDYNVAGMAMGSDGNLLMAVSRYEYDTDENGEITDSRSTLELITVSPSDGSVKNTMDLTEVMGGGENAYIQQFTVDGQGNIYLSDGNSGIHVLDKDLKKICDITTDNWINSMLASNEGDVYISSYGETGMELKMVDLAGKKLGEAVQGVGGGFGNREFFPSVSQSFLVRNSEQISYYDLEAQATQDLYKWLDVDINSENVNYMGELSDGRIWAVTRDYEASASTSGGPEYELVLLSRKDAAEVAEKQEILYGTMWLDSNVKRNIINFNKSNSQYRITVKEYVTEDFQSGITQFNADLTTGDCPDIIELSSLDFSQYASKGILEDLYPYMEKSGINKDDYLENILKAYEWDGKLCGLIPRFYISTSMAKVSQVGDVTGWTLEEMLDFAETKEPEQLFQGSTRDGIFYYCIYNNIDEFINWETGECMFTGEGFIRTLEFAAKFPEEYNYNEEEEREGIASQIRNDKILLMQNSISSVQEYQMMNGMFGEKIAFLGYPNSERKGNLIQPTGGCMGLSSKSDKKDGAWEFMKTMISKEYQDSFSDERGGGWGFPVRKDALEKQFEKDMAPEYYEDENGEKVEQPKTTWGWDDFEMEIMAATQEEVDGVKALIVSAEKLPGNSNDEQLTNIITEESAPFFKGQKTAKDTAAVIQNRIQIYVNENR